TVDEGLKSNVSALGAWIGNLPVIGNSLVALNIGQPVWCAYANPYLSRFFSSGGELTIYSGDSMFDAVSSVLGTDGVAPIKVWTVSEEPGLKYQVGDEDAQSFSLDTFSKGLNDYTENQEVSFIKFNYKIPAWVCFLTYGLLPMLVLYFFLRDLLDFTLFSALTKQLISIFASLMAVQVGMFSSFVLQIAKIAKMSAGGAFLSVVFFMSIISVLMSWMGTGAKAAARAKKETQQMVEGIVQEETAGAFFKAFRKKK
ncbi:MAG: hypothetical protein GOV00_04100, partial [Candidatus Altiarchaeota archaeon]|nr:hypothetical protein [Candidatus Altiarchaeota archaeon]